MRQLEENLTTAWSEFEAVQGGSHDLADRALAGVRSALDSLRTATARTTDDEPAAVTLSFFDVREPERHHHDSPPGSGIGERERRSFGIPDRFGEPPFHLDAIDLSIAGRPGVSVCDGERIVWEREAGRVLVEGNGRGQGPR
jgi:hypothetical protein